MAGNVTGATTMDIDIDQWYKLASVIVIHANKDPVTWQLLRNSLPPIRAYFACQLCGKVVDRPNRYAGKGFGCTACVGANAGQMDNDDTEMDIAMLDGCRKLCNLVRITAPLSGGKLGWLSELLDAIQPPPPVQTVTPVDSDTENASGSAVAPAEGIERCQCVDQSLFPGGLICYGLSCPCTSKNGGCHGQCACIGCKNTKGQTPLPSSFI